MVSTIESWYCPNTNILLSDLDLTAYEVVENEKSQLLYIDKGAYPESIKLLVERNYSLFETPSQLLAMETLILKG